MKKHVLLFLCSMLFVSVGFSQVYLDEFDNDDPAFTGGSGTYTSSESNSEWTVNASNTGPWDVFTYEFHDPTSGAGVLVDMTENNKIFVKVKASNVGTQLRMDVQDEAGFLTSIAGVTKTMTTEFMVLEFDFSGTYQDGGFGGTPCTSDTAPCAVDGTKIKQLIFFTDPGAGGFNGSVVFDYIAVGAEAAGAITSDVFQDHFDKADSTITSFGADVFDKGYNMVINGSELVLSGDGTTQMWDAIGYTIRNQNTFEEQDIDVTGTNKLFVKVKSSVPGTALRIDIRDLDGFITTQGSITKIVDTEYTVLEYDFSGTYADLGFGGTPCTMETAPCPVDGKRVAGLVLFVEPGVGGFVGDLTFDYFSFGNSLEPAGEAPVLSYGDHFSNETVEFTSSDLFNVTESGSNLVIAGDGTAPPFGTVSYLLHNKEVGEPVTLDMGPAQNRLYIAARTNGAMVPLRIDAVDSLNFHSSMSSITKIIGPELTVFEYNFEGASDGGFGGTACETGPCTVDLSKISQFLLYPNPIEGGYNGEIIIDFISIGQPLGEEEIDLGPAGIADYSDQFDENTTVFLNEVPGLTSTFSEDALSITGDGSSGMWNSIVYGVHNTAGELIMANAIAGGNKVYIKARSSVDGTILRVDLQDNIGFVTNANAVSTALSTDYVVYELDYTNAYADGGFGGSPCTSDTAPCPVDGARIANLQFFIEPGVGLFNGTVDIDWISFGSSLDVVEVPAGVANYNDELDESTTDQITDVPGLVTSIAGDTWTVTGDGAGGMWTPLVYKIHDAAGEGILANAAASGDRVFIRAKSSIDGTELRMDLQDHLGFVTNANAQSNTIATEYAVYEYNYSGAYADGGFGGSDCTSATAPCPVDAERISQVQLFVNPGVGGFNGVLDIDWISFGAPLTTSIVNAERLTAISAYPNPARQQVVLEYDLRTTSDIQVKVYNVFGKQLDVHHLGLQATGQQQQLINMESYTNGVYILQLTSNGNILGAMRLMKN